ncbi:MAG TPA: methyltransferase domain-containing protein [Verrucomicrobiae bacterium]
MSAVAQFSRLLALPWAYRAFRRIIGTERSWRVYLQEYVMPAAGEKVLDLGCGPADVLRYLPDVAYTGIDISQEYVESARRRFGGARRFLCEDVSTFSFLAEQGSFDLALATGVVHHLTDKEAGRLFEFARLALRPGGRLVTFDGCYIPDQSKMAGWVLGKDRGKFVRTRDEYERLAATAFSHVQGHLRHDLLRIPYTHLIMCCRN